MPTCKALSPGFFLNRRRLIPRNDLLFGLINKTWSCVEGGKKRREKDGNWTGDIGDIETLETGRGFKQFNKPIKKQDRMTLLVLKLPLMN